MFLLGKLVLDIRKGLPLGAAVEQLAAKGKNLVSLPYVVKGMDFLLAAC